MPGIRRQARMIALQTLYEYDIANHTPTEVLQRHAEERHLHPKAVEYASELVLGVCDHLAEIDAHIQSAAREWPLQQMARIDKNILRLAIYEILFNNTVPAKAAINEAVELAKAFGSDTSSRFINGVLATSSIHDRLKKIIVDQLGVDESEVVPNASFVEDLNADSLDLVELIMSLEEEFKLQISDEDAEKITTVQEAEDYIEEHLR